MKNIFENYLLVSDMDATLLSDDHTISENNLVALRFFTEHGGRFTVASGRMVDAVGKYVRELPINAPAVLHNGAKVYDYNTQRVLFERMIEDERKQAIRRIHDDVPELGIEIYSDEVVYVYRACKQTERFRRLSYDVCYELPDEIWDRPWIKALLIGDKPIVDKYEPLYRAKYDSGNAVRSGDSFLDIVANGVSKGGGVEQVARLLGIDRAHIAAIGDNMNDLSMLQAAGHSFCVANAEQAVKDAVQTITPDNNHDALAYVVQQLKNAEK